MKTLERNITIQLVKEGNILSPKGFKAAGLHAGLRYSKKILA